MQASATRRACARFALVAIAGCAAAALWAAGVPGQSPLLDAQGCSDDGAAGPLPTLLLLSSEVQPGLWPAAQRPIEL